LQFTSWVPIRDSVPFQWLAIVSLQVRKSWNASCEVTSVQVSKFGIGFSNSGIWILNVCAVIGCCNDSC
jgi:hypothetical protein